MSDARPLTVDDAVEATIDLVDDRARDRLVIRGADAATYLHSQLAQDVTDLPVGASRWTLLLEPTGKVDSLGRLRRTGETAFELDTEAGFGAATETRLRRFMIRVDVDISVEPAASAAPDAEHEARRIAAGWPRLGAEIEPGSTIPATTGVVPVAVSFTKGCYPGQELVERMDSRGADAPRRLRVIEVDDGAVAGDAVEVDGVEVGVVTSVSPMGGLAIASVKRGAEVGRPPAHLAD